MFQDIAFLSAAYVCSARPEPVCLSGGVVAPVPWPREDTERDVEGDAVFAQRTRRVCRTLGNACADHGIDEQRGDLIRALDASRMRRWLRSRHASRAGNPEDMTAVGATTFDSVAIVCMTMQGAVESFRCHLFIVQAKRILT
jgi:hypothetical protein